MHLHQISSEILLVYTNIKVKIVYITPEWWSSILIYSILNRTQTFSSTFASYWVNKIHLLTLYIIINFIRKFEILLTFFISVFVVGCVCAHLLSVVVLAIMILLPSRLSWLLRLLLLFYFFLIYLCCMRHTCDALYSCVIVSNESLNSCPILRETCWCKMLKVKEELTESVNEWITMWLHNSYTENGEEKNAS